MKTQNDDQKQPAKYWLVDIELTSGEVLQFYVKARSHFDSMKKAYEYADLVENRNLLNGLRTFKLMV